MVAKKTFAIFALVATQTSALRKVREKSSASQNPALKVSMIDFSDEALAQRCIIKSDEMFEVLREYAITSIENWTHTVDSCIPPDSLVWSKLSASGIDLTTMSVKDFLLQTYVSSEPYSVYTRRFLSQPSLFNCLKLADDADWYGERRLKTPEEISSWLDREYASLNFSEDGNSQDETEKLNILLLQFFSGKMFSEHELAQPFQNFIRDFPMTIDDVINNAIDGVNVNNDRDVILITAPLSVAGFESKLKKVMNEKKDYSGRKEYSESCHSGLCIYSKTQLTDTQVGEGYIIATVGNWKIASVDFTRGFKNVEVLRGVDLLSAQLTAETSLLLEGAIHDVGFEDKVCTRLDHCLFSNRISQGETDYSWFRITATVQREYRIIPTTEGGVRPGHNH